MLRNIDPSIMAANKMATNQAYEIMGIRTHIEQSWVWHYLSNLARSKTPGTGIVQDRTISESLAWMNRAANEVGLL